MKKHGMGTSTTISCDPKSYQQKPVFDKKTLENTENTSMFLFIWKKRLLLEAEQVMNQR